MSITQLECEGYRLVRLTGFLDGRTRESDEVQSFLDQAMSHLQHHYVLDLSQVEYVNSSMLGQFLRFLNTAQERNHRLLLMNPPPSINNILDLTGLSALLPVVQDEAGIRAQLGSAPAKRMPGRTGDVNFDELANEIETIVKGEAPADQGASQLGRILGD